MNLVEMYVSNITYVSDLNKFGFRYIIADTNCYGVKTTQQTICVSDENYKMILEKGYYLC